MMLIQRIRRPTIVHVLLVSFFLVIAKQELPAQESKYLRDTNTPAARAKKPLANEPAAPQEKFSAQLERARKLYDDMDYAGAIKALEEARKIAVMPSQKSAVFFFLSLSYYATLVGDDLRAVVGSIENLLTADYEWVPDKRLCPARWIEIFNEIKSGYGTISILSKPQGADVFIASSAQPVGQTPLTVGAKAGHVKIRIQRGSKTKDDEFEVVAGRKITTPVYEMGGKFPILLLIAGGALIIGAILLFTKSKVTETSPPPNATLTFTAPAGGTNLTKGWDVEIKWQSTGLKSSLTSGLTDLSLANRIASVENPTLAGDLAKDSPAKSMVNLQNHGREDSQGRPAPKSRTSPLMNGNSRPAVQRGTGPAATTYVKIDLYKGSTLVQTIQSSIVNSGSYTWTVGTSLAYGTDYKIRITRTDNSNVYAESSPLMISDYFTESFASAANVAKYYGVVPTSTSSFWSAVSGAYQMSGGGPNQRTTSYYNPASFSPAGSPAGSYTVGVDCMAGTVGADTSYGISFGGDSSFSSYYVFYVNLSNQQYRIIQVQSSGTETDILAFVSSPAINKNANQTNALSLKASSDGSVDLSINGTLVRTINVGTAAVNGKIGLTTRANYQNVAFDNLTVKSP